MRGSGTAILLFGNNVLEPARAVYERWHAGHHVPQRLTVPGILGAIRFRLSGQGSPEYLTLYRLRDADVLESAEYRALVEFPDEPTLAMRPNLYAPRRYVAQVGLVPAIPEGWSMRAFEGDHLQPDTRDQDLVVIEGDMLAGQRNHPIMGTIPLPSGRLRLCFGPAEWLQGMGPGRGKPIGGVYQPIDRFGSDRG